MKTWQIIILGGGIGIGIWVILWEILFLTPILFIDLPWSESIPIIWGKVGGFLNLMFPILVSTGMIGIAYEELTNNPEAKNKESK